MEKLAQIINMVTLNRGQVKSVHTEKDQCKVPGTGIFEKCLTRKAILQRNLVASPAKNLLLGVASGRGLPHSLAVHTSLLLVPHSN